MIIQTAAVVPVKQLFKAKQRLSHILNQQERADLALAMLKDVLGALQECQHIDRIYIITSDTAVADLAKQCHADIIHEPVPSGLNPAVTKAGKELAEKGLERMIFVPGDLPLLTEHELDQVLSCKENTSVAIVPATDQAGSNCIVCSPPDCLPFSFGEQSFDHHLKTAENLKLKTEVLHLHGIGLDIDTEDDLKQLTQALIQSKKPGTHTAQYLTISGLLNRLTQKQNQHQSKINTASFLNVDTWKMPEDEEALALSYEDNTSKLMTVAARLRDEGHGQFVSFSKKIFIPLTHLCRDVCHYCTFAQVPRKLKAPYLSPEEVLGIARDGAKAGCKEALFTLGDNPELRYKAARNWLDENGYSSTLDYLEQMAKLVFTETGLLPHLNPGLMSEDELLRLKKVSVSMGIMLESASERLTEKGMPHYGSPDKIPAKRIETIRLAGEQAIPFTSGILIGIGETRQERVEALLTLRNLHQQYGHIQEIIIQNFRAKPETKMSRHAEPDLNEMLWTLALARIIFGPTMNIQAPPNLSPGALPQLINAGINDWGGVSPVTPDFVNPEAPWPHLDTLVKDTRESGKQLVERLAIYPAYALDPISWVVPEMEKPVFDAVDGSGLVRSENWYAGSPLPLPTDELKLIKSIPTQTKSKPISEILHKVSQNAELNENDIVTLLKARSSDFTHVCQTANDLRKSVNGDDVTYVVNRNINYTNICYFHCKFCAFSKGKTHENLRGKPYNIDSNEITSRAKEAWARGATEVCLQGGIHPEYTGQTYLDICKAIKESIPDMHIHAFSPLEIWQGAKTLDLPLADYLSKLKQAGLSTLPGTAAEILDDEIRAIICPDKINTKEWLEVMETAHDLGLKTTATIMFGHVEQYQHIARHLLRIRQLQKKTGGFTEFVPLPFVHMEAPIYLKGKSRKGPTFREAILIHAIARLVLHPYITNIQASWPKLGHEGLLATLNAGVNDLGGTLMNESITRSAGASHGQELTPTSMEELILSAGRVPRQRTTTYALVEKNSRQVPLSNSHNSKTSIEKNRQIPVNQITATQ